MAPLSSSFYDQQKSSLRLALRQARPLATPRQRRLIIQHIFRVLRQLNGRKVAAVWPLPGEIDLRPLCIQAYRTGYYQIVLPQTPPKGEKLHFRLWTPSTRMKQGRFGTRYPMGPVEAPDVILVPLLGFDRQGGRIGYGGGYYDRTLAAWPKTPSIGYALACQECHDVPMDHYDQRLHHIVTERELIHVSKA